MNDDNAIVIPLLVGHWTKFCPRYYVDATIAFVSTIISANANT